MIALLGMGKVPEATNLTGITLDTDFALSFGFVARTGVGHVDGIGRRPED